MSELQIRAASKDRPYYKGQCAFCNGLSPESNPFHPESNDYVEWSEGYEQEALSTGDLIIEFELIGYNEEDSTHE